MSDGAPGPLSALRLARGIGFVLLLALAGYSSCRLQRGRDGEEEAHLRQIHTLAGTVEQHPGFHSVILGQTRRVWVYLPPQYTRQLERRFPVLYMHDGQNVFDGATAFLAGKEWEVDETVESLAGEGRIERWPGRSACRPCSSFSSRRGTESAPCAKVPPRAVPPNTQA